MSTEQITILIILALSIGAMFWILPDIRDAFAEPFDPRGEGEAAGEINAGGDSGTSANRLDTHTHREPDNR
jgi:hypothetical protein